MYSGQIQSSGPRYCPSIEDKVVRFADKERHQLFLEPEGRNTLEYYVNGISTSLPRDVQDAILRLVPESRRGQTMGTISIVIAVPFLPRIRCSRIMSWREQDTKKYC